jgi:hypothetical protein
MHQATAGSVTIPSPYCFSIKWPIQVIVVKKQFLLNSLAIDAEPI